MTNLPRNAATTWVPESQMGLLLLAISGSVCLALCARIQVPMWPVPMTMQSFGVMALGLALGARMGVAAVSLYLVQGALGLPVFAAGGGIAHFFGPTGGYLLGFLPMVWLIGTLADRGWSRSVLPALGATLAGGILLYLCGGLWLATLIGAETALLHGVAPFLPGDLLKALLAALAVPVLWKGPAGQR